MCSALWGNADEHHHCGKGVWVHGGGSLLDTVPAPFGELHACFKMAPEHHPSMLFHKMHSALPEPGHFNLPCAQLHQRSKPPIFHHLGDKEKCLLELPGLHAQSHPWWWWNTGTGEMLQPSSESSNSLPELKKNRLKRGEKGEGGRRMGTEMQKGYVPFKGWKQEQNSESFGIDPSQNISKANGATA